MVTSVSSTDSIADVFAQETQLMDSMIGFMLILSGVLGFAVVYNATIIGIGERETEFSALRVLGFSRGDIFRLVLKENNLTTVIGVLAGMPLANLLMVYFSGIFSTEQYSMILRAGPETYIMGLAVTVFFVVLAQVATYRKIRGLDFMAAIKSRI
jgi:putative ABC transport system permease protein